MSRRGLEGGDLTFNKGISLGRVKDPKESTSTIICKLFHIIVPNFSKKISFI